MSVFSGGGLVVRPVKFEPLGLDVFFFGGVGMLVRAPEFEPVSPLVRWSRGHRTNGRMRNDVNSFLNGPSEIGHRCIPMVPIMNDTHNG